MGDGEERNVILLHNAFYFSAHTICMALCQLLRMAPETMRMKSMGVKTNFQRSSVTLGRDANLTCPQGSGENLKLNQPGFCLHIKYKRTVFISTHSLALGFLLFFSFSPNTWLT